VVLDSKSHKILVPTNLRSATGILCAHVQPYWTLHVGFCDSVKKKKKKKKKRKLYGELNSTHNI